MYRQGTVHALESGNAESPAELATPLGDVRRAFAGYLQHDNKEETLRVYGATVIPALRDHRTAKA